MSILQAGWDQVRGVPHYGHYPAQPAPQRSFVHPVYPQLPIFPSVFPTINPGSINYNQVFPTQLPRDSHQADPRLDYILRQLFEVPPSRIERNNRVEDLPGGPSHGTGASTTIPATDSDARPSRVRTQGHGSSPIIPPAPQFHNRQSLHNLLTCNIDDSRSFTFMFDVSKYPTEARIRTDGHGDIPILDDQLFIPNLRRTSSRRCIISFDNKSLANYVLATSNITLAGFLWGLYDHFQEPLSANEGRRIQTLPFHYESAVLAMVRRCQGMTEPEQEWARGMKRIDILGRQTWFLAMCPAAEIDRHQGDICFRLSFMKQFLS